jgi:hypothetical protein
MMLKSIEVIVTHLVHNNSNNYFWGLPKKNKWNNQKAKANVLHYPLPFDGTDAGGLFGAGDDGGVLIGFGSLIGLETFGVLGSGDLKLIVGLAGSDVGLFTGSYSLGFDVGSIGLVGIGCAWLSGNFEGAIVFEFTTGCLSLSRITPSVAGGGVGIGFGVSSK